MKADVLPSGDAGVFSFPEPERLALVVDRHRLFAEALTPLLEDLDFVVFVATSPSEALELIASQHPKLALVDLSLPAQAGFNLGEQLLRARPDAIVIAVTSVPDPRCVGDSRRAGFWGCLSRDIPVSRLKSHLLAATTGRPIISPHQHIELGHELQRSKPKDLLAAQLTTRELEVLAFLVEGAGGNQIAKALEITSNTVRTHVQAILTKLQVHSRLEAAAVAVRLGLVSDDSTAGSGAA